MKITDLANAVFAQVSFIKETVDQFSGVQSEKGPLHVQILSARRLLSELDKELKKYPIMDEEAAKWEEKLKSRRERERW